MKYLIFTLCIILVVGTRCSGDSQRKKQTQTSIPGRSKTMATDFFGLVDDEYFDKPLKKLTQIGHQRVSAGDTGIFLGGPTVIPANKESAPFVIQRISTSQHATDYFFGDYAIICAVDLSTGRLFVSKAVVQKYIRPKRNPIVAPPGYRADGGACDLFEILQLPRDPARYCVSAFVLNQCSNQCIVSIDSKNNLSDLTKFENVLSKARASIIPEQPIHNKPYPRWNRLMDPSTKPDLSIDFTPQLKLTEIQELIVKGKITTDIQAVLPLSDTQINEIPLAGVLPLHIIATGTKTIGPHVATINIPIFKGNSEETLLGTGFSFDLLRYINFGKEEQSCYIYLLCDKLVRGPYSIDLKY